MTKSSRQEIFPYRNTHEQYSLDICESKETYIYTCLPEARCRGVKQTPSHKAGPEIHETYLRVWKVFNLLPLREHPASSPCVSRHRRDGAQTTLGISIISCAYTIIQYTLTTWMYWNLMNHYLVYVALKLNRNLSELIHFYFTHFLRWRMVSPSVVGFAN